MSRKLAKFILAGTLGGILNTPVSAGVIDWSTITLSGTFPSFSFTDPTLGTVDLSYSNDSELFGISTQFGGAETLVLGNTGGESLTMSWSNTITNLEMEIWDIDTIPESTGEHLTFVTSAAVTPVSLHTTDLWDSTTNTLSGDLTANPNSSTDNFSIMGFVDLAGFNSITFNWDAPGSGTFGIGDIITSQSVPEPTTLFLIATGLAGLGFASRKKKPS